MLGSRRVSVWVVRLAWVSLPFTAGPTLADALDGASRPVQVLASAGLWAGWVAGLTATLVALPVALTVLRVLAPAALVAAVAAALGTDSGVPAVAVTALAAVAAFAPDVAEEAVNGPAYGDERRFPLRPPGPLLLGPLAVAWAVTVAGVTAGPLLLAARQWAGGAVALVVGLPVGFVTGRSLHALSQRWLVFVPAGLVLHDPLTLADPILFPRRTVRRIGAAPAASPALDLTQRALGLAVEVSLDGPASLSLVRPGRRQTDTVEADAFLVAPSRPGRVVADARRRRFSTS